MRLKAVYLLTVAAGVAVALTMVGSAAAIIVPNSDPACGKTLITSFTLTADINCDGFVSGSTYYSGPALKIGQAGITINLNGHTITGDNAGDPVIDNTSGTSQGYDGLTITGGTLVANGAGPAIVSTNGDGLTVSNMTITGPKGALPSTGIDPTRSTGIMITGNTMTGFSYDVVLDNTSGAVVHGNTLTPWNADGKNTNCAGVREVSGTNDMVTGNTFAGDASFAAPSCDGLYSLGSAGTQFSGNTSTYNDTGIAAGSGASLTISGNTVGAANPAGGDTVGISLFLDAGSMVEGNYVRNSNWWGVATYKSNNDVFSGNVLTSNGNNSILNGGTPAGYSNLFINALGYGPVTLVNNYSRLAGRFGYRIISPFNNQADIPTPPYSTITGNAATYNVDTGFYLYELDGATITHNTAYQNGGNGGGDGFFFEEPAQATIADNTATLNEREGFSFAVAYDAYAALSFANNTATYNGDYGFKSYDLAVSGSGNTAGNNGTGSCYLVAGCS